MKVSYTLAPILFASVSACFATTSACGTATLDAYLNGGDPDFCTLGADLTVGFNDNILPSYAGLNVGALSQNTAVGPTDITVNPGSSSLDFAGTFQQTGLAATEEELVQFTVGAAPGTDLTSTTFSLDNPQTGTGLGGLGTGVVVGQELVCVGGTFGSLPTGIVTNVLNGVLGTNEFGCSGVVLVGTAGLSSGPLNAVTSLLDLPTSLDGLTDSATITIGTPNTNFIDVIKIQALVSTVTGTASTAGFGDSFATSMATPEPSTLAMFLGGLLLIGAARFRSKAD